MSASTRARQAGILPVTLVAIAAVSATASSWRRVGEQFLRAVQVGNDDGVAALAVAACAWLLWRGRHALRAARPDGTRWWLVLAALALHRGGLAADWRFVEQAGALLFAPALASLFLTSRAPGVLLPAWCALLFALPLPGMLVEHVAVPLRYAEARAVEMVALLAGFEVARDGLVVVLAGTPVRIEEGCSGFALLWPTLLACWVALALVPRPWDARGLALRAIALGVAATAAIAANLLRVTISVFTYARGSAALAAAVHDALG
ncbi:MAG: archaeosortase/exosortase family protein, partial [Pseudomonadales bacterium]|nr:archaeosortase/exosortase family protein [Pseudomonadales bacterium]